MQKLCLLLLIAFTIQSCTNEKPTEIIVIGTQHKPVPNFDENTLYDILESVQPDLLLNEADTGRFTADWKYKIAPNSNESIASTKYVDKHEGALLRPYEFENRNQYRIDQGMRPTESFTHDLLDSLYEAGMLSEQEEAIVKEYNRALEPLLEIAAGDPKGWNNITSDSLCAYRQYYQYQMLTKITNSREEFANRFHTKPDGEPISFREGYQRYANFWDLRNQTMAKNIMNMTDKTGAKRIVVLCGFMHRYYILSELKRLTKNKNIVLKEFYDY